MMEKISLFVLLIIVVVVATATTAMASFALGSVVTAHCASFGVSVTLLWNSGTLKMEIPGSLLDADTSECRSARCALGS
jgi:hypothetical protein